MTAATRFERLDKLLPAMLQRWAWPLTHPRPAGQSAIRIDLCAGGEGCEVHAELRGAKREDIRVSIDGDFVSISAELERDARRFRHAPAERTQIRELFSLPFQVDEDATVATYGDGVLTLSLHKKPRASDGNPGLH